ncbi:type VI secretion system contractile sheath small subunit [Acidimicrobium ferrooxidans]|nr:type VI secretion system contractile sheath small subunit [Acidimicrobium ferrooxidans]
MSSEGSVAPKERVNIVYEAATGDAKEEKELPLKLLMLGDYTLRSDETPLENRKPININKDNFNEVLKAQSLEMDINVPNQLSEAEGDDEMAVHLKFANLKDFGPEAVARQVPEMNKLLELREALTALKGPLGNLPAFRKMIQGLIGDESNRAQILKELGVGE